MDWQQRYASKVLAAQDAVGKIKRGSRVFIGTGCGEPQHLIKAMVADPSLQDIMLYQMLSYTLSRFIDSPSFLKRFSLKLFFISRTMRKAAFEGRIDYIPSYLSEIPGLFSSNRIGLDAAIVQMSPPDKYGYCSLGVSVDITRAGLENARLVIAQINPRMPRTWGDSFIHVDDIDWYAFVHGGKSECRRELWLEERGTSGDLATVWVRCGCGKERGRVDRKVHHRDVVRRTFPGATRGMARLDARRRGGRRRRMRLGRRTGETRSPTSATASPACGRRDSGCGVACGFP